MLDTHIWIWWASQSRTLATSHRQFIEQHVAEGLGVSVISCWEVGKLVEKGRLKLNTTVWHWVDTALSLPGVELLPLTPRIAIESSQLPAPIHGDPADQILVATARILAIPLMTADQRLIDYPHVVTL
ncbi:MAG TPA: type II toxin-antitoxin system VapC family toxin [Lacipirellulaceae bacterium]